MVQHISREETNFSPHLDEVIPVELDVRVVSELKGSVDGNHRVGWVCVVNSSDYSLLSVSRVVVGRSNDDSFSYLPVYCLDQSNLA